MDGLFILLAIGFSIFSTISEQKKKKQKEESKRGQFSPTVKSTPGPKSVSRLPKTIKGTLDMVTQEISKYEDQVSNTQRKAFPDLGQIPESLEDLPLDTTALEQEQMIGCFEKSELPNTKLMGEGDSFYEENLKAQDITIPKGFNYEIAEDENYFFEDMQRAIIMSEILAKPKALRR